MQKALNQFIFFRLPVFVYCIAIFIQSSFPAPANIPTVPLSDKLLHFVGHGLLGALFLRAFRTFTIKNNTVLILFLSILLSSLYGLSDEIHQSFVPHRSADVYDVLADTIGSVLGVIVYQWLTKFSDRLL